VVVFFTGLVAYVLQLFGVRKHAAPAGPAPATDRQPRAMRDDEAIEVETTKVPDEAAKR